MCEMLPVAPSSVDAHVLVDDAALLSEHCEARSRFAPPGDDRATTSAMCKMKQLPLVQLHGPSIAGFQIRRVVIAGGARPGLERTTSGGDVSSAAVDQTLAVYPVDTTSPVGARSTWTMRSRLRIGQLAHWPPVDERGWITTEATGSSPETEKIIH